MVLKYKKQLSSFLIVFMILFPLFTTFQLLIQKPIIAHATGTLADDSIMALFMLLCVGGYASVQATNASFVEGVRAQMKGDGIWFADSIAGGYTVTQNIKDEIAKVVANIKSLGFVNQTLTFTGSTYTITKDGIYTMVANNSTNTMNSTFGRVGVISGTLNFATYKFVTSGGGEYLTITNSYSGGVAYPAGNMNNVLINYTPWQNCILTLEGSINSTNSILNSTALNVGALNTWDRTKTDAIPIGTALYPTTTANTDATFPTAKVATGTNAGAIGSTSLPLAGGGLLAPVTGWFGELFSWFSIDWSVVATHFNFTDVFQVKFKPFYDVTTAFTNLHNNPQNHSGKFYMTIPKAMAGDDLPHCVLDLTAGAPYFSWARIFIGYALWVALAFYIMKLFEPKITIN